MKLKLIAILIILSTLLCSCNGKSGINKAIKFTELEVMCQNKEEYSQLITDYKDLLSEEVLMSIRGRYLSAPITGYNELSVVYVTSSNNTVLVMTYDAKFSNYQLTMCEFEGGLITHYTTKILYEV